jgi:hypothetical protein
MYFIFTLKQKKYLIWKQIENSNYLNYLNFSEFVIILDFFKIENVSNVRIT